MIVSKRLFADFLWQTQINLIYYQKTATLTDDLRTIAFQLIVYKNEISIIFSNEIQETFDFVFSIHLKSASIRLKIKIIKSTFINLLNFDNYLFFFSKWIVDKLILNLAIKIFLQFIVDYRFSFLKFRITTSIDSTLSIFSCDQSSFQKFSFFDFIKSQKSRNHEKSMSTQTVKASNSRQLTKEERINTIVTRSLDAYFKTHQSSLRSTTQKNNNNDNEQSNTNEKEWTCEKIEFFDSTMKKTTVVINVKKHVFYRDVYTFVDRLKNMTISKKSNKFKNIISQCFKEFALIWHSTKLSNLKKNVKRSIINNVIQCLDKAI